MGTPKSGYIDLTVRRVFGRDNECDIQLDGIEVSRRHVLAEKVGDRCLVRDLGSKFGTLVNGRHIAERQLIFGDILTVGRHHFRFDGRALIPTETVAGASIDAKAIEKVAGEKTILRDISIEILPGEFVGILGTSGAGKSTLLDILSGIREASSGEVLISGAPVSKYLRSGPAVCGYVPQADIVHFELTVRQAVYFAAILRLPDGTPNRAIEDCVDETLDKLQIAPLASLPINRISGGQRKRVSVAVEILSRPSLLFLDEPSSGLDPATEFKLMEQLRDLANVGCTVVCTTHIMDNVHVFDRLVILRAGRLIFTGTPQKAKAHFEISRFVQLYERVESQPVDYWVSRFYPEEKGTSIPRIEDVSSAYRPKSAGKFWTLISRQCVLLVSDIKSPLVLVGQPLLIGALVAWVADASGFKLFTAHLATFWFGCSNASQEIVKEIAIYCRERLVGVSSGEYLAAKVLFWLVITLLQAAIMFTALHFGPKGLGGSVYWQIIGLAATAVTGVIIGFAISAWVKSPTQATLVVPLVLLPQVILSGFVLPPIQEKGVKKVISEILPSHASQFLMDTSLLWNTEVDMNDIALRADYFPAHQNVANQVELASGEIYDDDTVARGQVRKLVIWSLAGMVATWVGLKARERA